MMAMKPDRSELIKLYKEELEKLKKEIERYELQIKALQANLEPLLQQKKVLEIYLKELTK